METIRGDTHIDFLPPLEYAEEYAEAEYDEFTIDRMLMTLLMLNIINSKQDWSIYKHLRSYWQDHRRARKQILKNLNE